MSDIYDRSEWPAPENNPLVLLLLRGDEWYSNLEIVRALGLGDGRALLSQGAAFGKVLQFDDAGIRQDEQMVIGTDVKPPMVEDKECSLGLHSFSPPCAIKLSTRWHFETGWFDEQRAN